MPRNKALTPEQTLKLTSLQVTPAVVEKIVAVYPDATQYLDNPETLLRCFLIAVFLVDDHARDGAEARWKLVQELAA